MFCVSQLSTNKEDCCLFLIFFFFSLSFVSPYSTHFSLVFLMVARVFRGEEDEDPFVGEIRFNLYYSPWRFFLITYSKNILRISLLCICLVLYFYLFCIFFSTYPFYSIFWFLIFSFCFSKNNINFNLIRKVIKKWEMDVNALKNMFL